MAVLKTIITIIFALVCLALTIIVLLQEGKQAGLTGSINGAAETYWGKNKGRSMEGFLGLLIKCQRLPRGFFWNRCLFPLGYRLF